MSIRKQMILYFSGLIIVIFMLAEVINGWQAYRLLEENITSSIKEGLNLGVKNIEYYFQDAANVCSSIMADERTQNILECEITEDLDGKILGRELNKVVSQYASTRPYITKVYLLDKNNHIITPELQGEELGNFLIQEKNGSLFNISSLHRAGYLMGNVEVFSLVKTIYAYNDRTRRIGTIVADIDSRIVEEATGDYVLPLKGSLLLCDYQGNILAEIEDRKISWTKQAINNNTPKEEFVNIGRESLVTGWTLAAKIPRGEFLKAILSRMWLSLTLLGICLVIIGFVSRKIIHSIYEPLDLLGKSMKKMEAGDFHTQILYEKQDEFSTLINGYNLMVGKIRVLLEELVEKEKIKRNAELYALQAQISPHFLYNTLNSIRYYAKIYQASEIREMTTALIQLSKASLSSEKFISIEQELELTDEYLKIQRLRYGAIFEVNKEVDEILMNCLIPRFSIQPAVENALFHGILPKGSGIITIKIYSQEEEIIIEIIDNGIGLSKGQLRIINEELEMATFIGGAKEEISKLKNIGLENINYRIRMHYGKKEGGVRLYEENPGLKVKIIIPQKIYKI
ncbi:MAG: sensor histidine kinase [Marvinbryantia sp.]|jgi:two-component system sensor histidine kinase YesM